MAEVGSDAALETLRRAHAAGDPDLLGRLARAIEARRQSSGGHKAFGRLCEEAGAANLAVTCYQLTLRDDPADTEALSRLSEIFIELGHLDRAKSMAARWFQASPDDGNALKSLCEIHLMRGEPGPVKELLAKATGHDEVVAAIQARLALEEDEDPFVGAEDGTPLLPTEADVARFSHLFAGRENVYARQWSGAAGKTGYTPVREPLTMSVARNHLLGNITVGVYPVRLDNRVTFFAIDVDITKRAIDKARGKMKEASRLRALAASEGLRLMGLIEQLGFQPLLEDSGYKGRHLWVFLEAPEEASVVKRFGSLFLAVVPPASMDIHFEFFPKQAKIKKGIGNLIKLPLGIHRKSGRKSRLLGRDGQPAADPYASLRRVKKTPLDVLHGAILDLRQREIPPSSALDAEVETAGEATVAAPAPPPAEPAFTEADLDRDPEVAHLLHRCAVLGKLKDKVFKHRKLTHDEQVVLRHTLGHSGAGVLAVNYLLAGCVDVDPGALMKSPFSGNPISCPKIRKRIPEIAGKVDCHCHFESAPDHYPTPRLHLYSLDVSAGPPPPEEKPWDAEERARTLGVLWKRRERLDQEIAAAEKELLAFMQSGGIDSLDLGDGTLVMKQEAGAPPALLFEPAAPSKTTGGDAKQEAPPNHQRESTT